MLKLMHRYQKSIFSVALLVVVAFSMLGFGVSYFDRGGYDERYAIAVNDEKVGLDEFYRERAALESRYRRMLGENFETLEKSLEIPQAVKEKMISDLVLMQAARSAGMATGPEEVHYTIKNELFQGQFNPGAYASYVSRMGMTVPQFEQKLREELLRNQFVGLLHDSSLISEQEARALYTSRETALDVKYVELSPEAMRASIATPSDEDLGKFYSEDPERFRVGPRVSYIYAVIPPEKFLAKVDVQPSDIEAFYEQRRDSYKYPEQVKARHIQLLYPEGQDPAVMSAVEEKAKSLHERVKNGESLAELAREHSDDLLTRDNGGDLGWLQRGKMAKEFDLAAFKQTEGGLADLVRTDYGFHVVSVEDYKPALPKDLSEVRAEIEAELRKRDAPLYVAEEGRHILDTLKKSGDDLQKAASDAGLTLKASPGLAEQGSDPEPSLAGLTEKVIAEPDALQLALIGDQAVLVQVKERRESEVPPLSEIKDRVVESYISQKSDKAAKAAADNIFAEASKIKALDQAARAFNAEVKEAKGMKKGAVSHPVFSSPELSDDLFEEVAQRRVGSKVFQVQGKYYVYQIDGVTVPPAPTSEMLIRYQLEGTQEAGQVLLRSVLNRARNEAKIDVDEAVFGS